MRKLDKTSVRLSIRAGIVEADLSLLAYTDNHKVNFANRLVVLGAILRDFALRYRTIGNMYILRLDVDILQKLIVDTIVTALLLGTANGVELIK